MQAEEARHGRVNKNLTYLRAASWVQSLLSTQGKDPTWTVGAKSHFPGTEVKVEKFSKKLWRPQKLELSLQNKEHWASVFKLAPSL